jgi:hypothetical protein
MKNYLVSMPLNFLFTSNFILIPISIAIDSEKFGYWWLFFIWFLITSISYAIGFILTNFIKIIILNDSEKRIELKKLINTFK